MKIIILYHQSRKPQALIQHQHLRSFFTGEIFYICDNCKPPVDEPYSTVTLNHFSRQGMCETLTQHSGTVCVLDSDRLIAPDFLRDPPPQTALYPKYLYFTGKPFNSFERDLINAKKEKVIDVYNEVCCYKVPTSGTTIMHVEDWERSRSPDHIIGYGFGDVATFLDMQRSGVRFVPSNSPVLHLHHGYDMPMEEFIAQNKANAYKLAARYQLPIGSQIKQLP